MCCQMCPCPIIEEEPSCGQRLDGLGDMERAIFSYGLLSVTLIPWLFFCLVSGQVADPALASVKAGFVLVGASHVPATIAFYGDAEFRRISMGSPSRYLFAPAGIIVGAAVVFALLGPMLQGLFLSVFWLWQTWHYGRQNLGVNAFVAIAQGRSSPHPREKVLITAGTVAGMCGILQVLALSVLPESLRPLLSWAWHFGAVVFGAVALALAWYLATARPSNVLSAVVLAICSLFFAPMFLARGIEGMFLSYAIAHACQYFLFITIATANQPAATNRALKAALASGMIVFALALGWLLTRILDLRQTAELGSHWLVNLAVGAALGVTMAHFIVDAGIWKLSNKLPRAFIHRRFAFVFQPTTTIASGT
jgi:uncharacterized membrane-anchored protein